MQVSAFKGQRRLLKDGSASKPVVSSGYSASGTVSPTVMQADLGNFGKVDLAFHPQKTTHPKPERGCTGHITKKTGVWKGTFKFRGEHGFTKASATKIDGSYESGSATCSTGPPPGHRKYVVLTASNSPFAKGSFYFSATRPKSGGKPSVSASASETQGDIEIFRNAYITGKTGDFTYNSGYTKAKVKGRGPFSGIGNFDNGDLSGSLKVRFPGETVGLTGPGVNAQLGENTSKSPLDAP